MAKLAVVLRLQRMQPDMQVVERLEEILADARAGKVVGLAMAVHYGANAYGYFGAGSLVDKPELGLAASTRLKQRFL